MGAARFWVVWTDGDFRQERPNLKRSTSVSCISLEARTDTLTLVLSYGVQMTQAFH